VIGMTKRYVWGALFYFLAIIGFFLPIAIMINARYEQWVTQADGISVAGGVIIGIVYAVLVAKGVLKKVSWKASLPISTFVMWLIIAMLKSVINDLGLIMLMTTFGTAIFIIFQSIGQRQFEIAKEYNNEKIRETARADYQTTTELKASKKLKGRV